jgi:hypothetical protein
VAILKPAGIGAVLDFMMIWQRLQVRHLHDTALIFAGPMWEGLADRASQMMLRLGFEVVRAEDMRIRTCI